MSSEITQDKTERLHEYCSEKLTNHFENSNYFMKEFAEMYSFYLKKFNHIVTEDYMEDFKDKLYESAKTQFYNGYFIAREFIDHDETTIPDEWLLSPDGILKEQIPHMLFEAGAGDFNEIIRTATAQKLVSWSITKFEDIRGLLQQTFIDITLLGSWRAFKDERDTRGLSRPIQEHTSFLAEYNDLLFLDPQKYLMCLMKNDGSETWEIHLWSSLQVPETKIGEVSIHKLTTSNLSVMSNFPAYDNAPEAMANHEKLYVSISVLQSNNEEEIDALINNIVLRIVDQNNLEMNNIALSTSLINRYI